MLLLSDRAVTGPLNHCSTQISLHWACGMLKLQLLFIWRDKQSMYPHQNLNRSVWIYVHTCSDAQDDSVLGNFSIDGMSPVIHILWVSSTKWSVDARGGDVVSTWLLVMTHKISLRRKCDLWLTSHSVHWEALSLISTLIPLFWMGAKCFHFSHSRV